MIPSPPLNTIQNKKQYEYVVKNLKIILASVRFEKDEIEMTDMSTASASVSVADAVRCE